MDRLGIARALREIGRLIALKGDAPFRSRAYERAARALEKLPGEVGPLVAAGELTRLRDIGPRIAAVIGDLHRTGEAAVLTRLRAELPPGVLELAEVPSLSLSRISALHAALGIDSVAALEAACLAGRVRALPGFGAATEARILEGVGERARRGTAVPIHVALEVGEQLLAHLRAWPGTEAAELAGALRRRHESVERVPVVVATGDPEGARARFLRFPTIEAAVPAHGAALTARLVGGVEAELRTASRTEYAVVLNEATGSEAHRRRLLALAVERGLVLQERQLRSGPRTVRVDDEAGLYGHLGLAWIPPELREDLGEVEAALAGELPADLVAADDVRGLVHCHTRYSDGRNTVEEMARAAEALGMDYITITDHSPTASYAGGLTLDRLRRQWDEIARVQESVRVTILRGTESDILADGSLDYPDAVLEQLDVIVASIHTRHKMDSDQMTRRLVRAMRLPYFKVWGHALGRLVGRRPPIECRLEEVLDAAAASRVAVEVNGDPRRLDMPPEGVRAARARGVPFVISTDAHSVAELRNLRHGVDAARRGWVRRGEVLNVLPAEGFRRAVRPAG